MAGAASKAESGATHTEEVDMWSEGRGKRADEGRRWKGNSREGGGACCGCEECDNQARGSKEKAKCVWG